MSAQDTLQTTGTPYAQVPVWILRSGANLSNGARAVYGVIMSYADNNTRVAFPSRETLAEDLGVSVATVKRAIKELENFGALNVTRQRNKRTGNFFANRYTLVFDSPRDTGDPRLWCVDDPRTTPIRTTPILYTSDLRSDQKKSCTSEQSSDAKNPGGLSRTQRTQLIRSLQAVGQLLQAGHKFYDEDPYYAWAMFTDQLSQAFPEKFDEYFADLLHNGKWTVSAKVADPYEAGVQLNKIINTGASL